LLRRAAVPARAHDPADAVAGRSRRAACSTSLTRTFDAELGDPLLQEAPLGVRVDELECALVGSAGLVDAFKASQELGPGRVEVVEVSGHRRGLSLRFEQVRLRRERAVAEEADQCSEDAAPFVAEGLLEDG
jgi:hypothetical protein